MEIVRKPIIRKELKIVLDFVRSGRHRDVSNPDIDEYEFIEKVGCSFIDLENELGLWTFSALHDHFQRFCFYAILQFSECKKNQR